MTATLLLAGLLLTADKPAVPPPDAAVEKARQEEVARLAPAEARVIKVLSGESRSTEARLHAEPVLRFSNPTAGSVHGEVFLWTIDKRPVAIAAIYRWYHPYKDSTVEFVSVGQHGIEARDDLKTQWDTNAPGVRFADLPGAPRPGDSANNRLIQMRSLARRFSAELADFRGGEEVARDLRLLNQPLHRYDCPSQKVLDGAIFAFVEGTDPEAWIILEAITSDAAPTWRFALARMNSDGLQIRDGDKVVQRWEDIRDTWADRTTSYATFNFDPARLKLAEPRKESP